MQREQLKCGVQMLRVKVIDLMSLAQAGLTNKWS